MKKTLFVFPALALTAGCLALPPKETTPEMLAGWDAAVASIGCDLVSEKDYLPVELQTGLPREKVIEIAQYKVSVEEAVSLENGGVRSVVGNCTPAPEAAQVAQKG